VALSIGLGLAWAEQVLVLGAFAVLDDFLRDFLAAVLVGDGGLLGGDGLAVAECPDAYTVRVEVLTDFDTPPVPACPMFLKKSSLSNIEFEKNPPPNPPSPPKPCPRGPDEELPCPFLPALRWKKPLKKSSWSWSNPFRLKKLAKRSLAVLKSKCE
jgi:hypothetical protein